MLKLKFGLKNFSIGLILGLGIIGIILGVFLIPFFDKRFDFFNIYNKENNLKFLGGSIFGCCDILASKTNSLENYLVGCSYECPVDGIANDITVYLYNDHASTDWNKNVKCALYLWNESDKDNSLFYAETEQKTILLTANSANANWFTFNFTSTVYVYSDVWYLVVAWGQSGPGNCKSYRYGPCEIPDQYYWYDSQTYGSWPNPTVHTGYSGNNNVSIFCSYTSIESDFTSPDLILNFAGNLSDSGGPYWSPPDESTQLTGSYSDGYYTNASYQSEEGIYINVIANDIESNITDVWLNWLNGTTWTNWTYAFNNVIGYYWEYNTIGNIQTCEGYNYSFDIIANSSGGSTLLNWNKTGIDGSYTRRYVQLNCSPINISYSPLYFFDSGYYSSSDVNKKDRLQKDFGTDGGQNDIGYLRSILNDDNVEYIYCGAFVVFWYDNNFCNMPLILNNIYTHFWWANDDSELEGGGAEPYGVYWDKTREEVNYDDYINGFDVDSIVNCSSNITWDNGDADFSNNYHLTAQLFDTTPTSFTDNDVYEFIFKVFDWGYLGKSDSSVISNRSFTSFILFNVPDNDTLNSTYPDSDSDLLSDWTELYVNHTNPFLSDTDYDGINDYQETIVGTDPNNYTDFILETISWHLIDSSKNGSWVNSTSWISIDSSKNGTWSNTTSWNLIDSSKNGTWTNTTTFQLIDSTKNGTWINTTIYHLIDSSKNGSWTNFSEKTWHLIDNTKNGTWTNTTTFQLIDDTKNGSWINTTTWNLIDSSKNGTWTNTTTWILIDNTKNGSWINISVPEWYLIDSSKNGTWTNTTSWQLIDNTKNGSWTNTTAFYLIDNTKNGTWTNTTSWILIDNTKNGSWYNLTEITWHLVDGISGFTFGETSEGTAWQNIKNVLSGSYYTAPSDGIVMNISVYLGNSHASADYSGSSKCGIYYWSNLSYYGCTSQRSLSLTHGNGNAGWFEYTIPDGLFLESGETYLIVCWATSGIGYCNMGYRSGSSSLVYQTITYGSFPNPYVIDGNTANINSCIYVNCEVGNKNGSWTNITSWILIDSSKNGSWVNSTSWILIDSSKNGTWINTTSWILIDNTKNGTWSNTTIPEWYLIDSSKNGSWSNTTSWMLIDSSKNGTWTNITSWKLIDNTKNGSWTNTTIFNLIDNTKNGSWINITIYQLIDNTKNGSWFNISWKLIDNTKNGTWNNETNWILIDSNKNGSWFNETLVWYLVDNSKNGSWVNISAIRITNIYPSNNSINIPIQPTLFLTVISPNGYKLNISFYYGPSLDNTPYLLKEYTEQDNGTYTALDYEVTEKETSYYWRVSVNDGVSFINQSYVFTSEAEVNIIADNSGRAIFSICFILGIIGFIWYRRRKNNNNNNNNNYQNYPF